MYAYGIIVIDRLPLGQSINYDNALCINIYYIKRSFIHIIKKMKTNNTEVIFKCFINDYTTRNIEYSYNVLYITYISPSMPMLSLLTQDLCL